MTTTRLFYSNPFYHPSSYSSLFHGMAFLPTCRYYCDQDVQSRLAITELARKQNFSIHKFQGVVWLTRGEMVNPPDAKGELLSGLGKPPKNLEK